ncbi:hypothetical protein [Actinocrispum wychmicini]|uniref:hypothetical protein n=1 Tax=Actinocrispum wychmicini TaxID=1213861 RepID=UPI001052A536|nr:hypothetical protein [Actinocrispum wychmicini]
MSDDDRPWTLRTLVIGVIAGVAAAFAAVPTWVVVKQIAAGLGGPLVPVSAAVVISGTVFWKAVDMLRRNVR